MTYDNSFRNLIAAALNADALSEAEVRSMEWAAMLLNARSGMTVEAAVDQAVANHKSSVQFHASQQPYVAPSEYSVSAPKYFGRNDYFTAEDRFIQDMMVNVPILKAKRKPAITVALMVERSIKARKIAAHKASNLKWAEDSFIRLHSRHGREYALTTMPRLGYDAATVAHVSKISDEYVATCKVSLVWGDVTRP